MTISTTNAKAGPYNGDGASVAFTVNFPFFTSAELEVIERTLSTGVEATKALTSDYTVSGGQDANGVPQTGTVTAIAAPSALVSWTIRRKTTQTQPRVYTSNDPFPAKSHEAALDRLTAIIQEIAEALSRGVSLAKTTTVAAAPTIPDPGAGLFVRWNALGTALELASVLGLGTIGVPVVIAQGGTGAADAVSARVNLGVERTRAQRLARFAHAFTAS